MAPDLVVPKFGNWDNPGNVQYTEYFERAGNSKTSSLDALISSTTRPKVVRGSESAAASASFNPCISAGYAVKSTRSPLHPCAVGVLPAARVSQQRIRGPQPRHYRSGIVGDTSFPFWERRLQYSSDISDYKVAPRTPKRLRIKPVVRREVAPNRGNSVPKFGDWDEGSPSGGERYTEIFSHVIDQKQSGGTETVPAKTLKSMTSTHNDSCDNIRFKVCLFCLWRRRRTNYCLRVKSSSHTGRRDAVYIADISSLLDQLVVVRMSGYFMLLYNPEDGTYRKPPVDKADPMAHAIYMETLVPPQP